MLIKDGCFYRLQDGSVVRVQEEAGELLSAYTVDGSRAHQCAVGDHVNGWEPVGKNDWDKARTAHKAEKASARKPRPKKAKKKEEGHDEEN